MLEKTVLGQRVTYIDTYTPTLLYPILRAVQREKLSIQDLPFRGADIWHGYEVSWLESSGKPVVALAEFIFPADSPYLIESKSFKLYLNSFNQTRFVDWETVKNRLEMDLSAAAGSTVLVSLFPGASSPWPIASLDGQLLDALDITCNTYAYTPTLLQTQALIVEETLVSHLLKSNCLVTGQPDWGSILIHYAGKKIDHKNLLQYLVSFRQHQEFHEHCVERIFCDILEYCGPTQLTVQAFYTRRGGLDICPFRTNNRAAVPLRSRLVRQ